MRAQLALVVLAAVLLAGCGKAQPEVGPRPTATPTLERPTVAGERNLLDMTGRPVSLPLRVERVVVLSPSAADFVVALGVQPVGRPGDSSNSALAAVPTIGATISPDFNAIAALDPDLVVADATYHGARTRDFERFPFPVYVIRVSSYDDVLAAFRSLGEALGRDREAAAAAAEVEQRTAAVVDRIAGAGPPSVLLITGSGREVYAGSNSTYAGSLLAKLNAVNVAGSVPAGAPIAGFGLIELSQAALLNPQVVLAISSGEGGLAGQVRASPAWAGTEAVSNGRVHELDASLFLRSPGPRAMEAIEELGRLLYPAR